MKRLKRFCITILLICRVLHVCHVLQLHLPYFLLTGDVLIDDPEHTGEDDIRPKDKERRGVPLSSGARMSRHEAVRSRLGDRRLLGATSSTDREPAVLRAAAVSDLSQVSNTAHHPFLVCWTSPCRLSTPASTSFLSGVQAPCHGFDVPHRAGWVHSRF